MTESLQKQEVLYPRILHEHLDEYIQKEVTIVGEISEIKQNGLVLQTRMDGNGQVMCEYDIQIFKGLEREGVVEGKVGEVRGVVKGHQLVSLHSINLFQEQWDTELSSIYAAMVQLQLTTYSHLF